ncbi:cytochrome b-c1 complex subunit 9 [Iris pallida]|uniref:Cytochrome b-c1 complex subunit 9 n=1 Tax=Iris pallida TaxID=29817 RepID=A0AAX6IET5_IRIPA|nr:cytochrome b-c1 complex subunit 9 [Iris pallida]
MDNHDLRETAPLSELRVRHQRVSRATCASSAPRATSTPAHPAHPARPRTQRNLGAHLGSATGCPTGPRNVAAHLAAQSTEQLASATSAT